MIVCLAATALLTACASSKPPRIVTVTASPSVPAGAQPTTSAGVTTSPAATPTPTSSQITRFRGTCDTLLPDVSVFDAIGVAALPGSDAYVVGKAETSIHRLAYLNCRYGVTGKGSAAKPAIEIGISLYATAADAASRITATVDDYTAHGASSSDVTVSKLPGKMLTGGVGDGYDVPLLVVASGQRTVAVSVAGSVATGTKAVSDATAVAALALKRTAP